MFKMVYLSPLLLLAACGGNPSTPPQVSWSYGAGNGDPMTYQGPAPRYSFANGLGQDMPVSAGNMPSVSRAYGADEVKGDTEQMTKPAPAQMASPTQPPSQNSHI